MPRRNTTHLAVLAAGFAAACGGSESTFAPVTPASGTPGIASTVVGGTSDGLATELLLAGATDALTAWHGRQLAVREPLLARNLDAMALDHLRSASLGEGTGPLLLGSITIRRLAVAPGAPTDLNGNGTNLDETLAAETERITAFAGALPAGTAAPVLPWHRRSASLQAPLPATSSSLPWRTTDLGDRTVRLAEIAQFVELRAVAARRLLRLRHGTRYGISDDEGTLGLLAMQQLLAAEDNLFATMFTTGGPLGALPDPDSYDPGQGARWLPCEFAVELDPQVAGAPLGFRATDAASDLVALAAVLHASAELTSVTDTTAAFALPELFRGQPFFPPPQEPVVPVLTWTEDIRPLLVFRCGQCHLQASFGDFSIATYQTMLLGGFTTRAMNLPMIVPGNAAASMLYRIVTNPPFPFTQMPYLGNPLPPAETGLIAAWIDSGARENAPAPPSPPQAGEDLARVSFKNLIALHFDEPSGALHHRVEADGPSGIATALATGHALQALAHYDRVEPQTTFRGWTPNSLLARIAAFACAQFVDGEGRCADATGIGAGGPSGRADLRAHAALTAGLLDAATRLPATHPAHDAARAAAQRLLAAFVDARNGLFPEREGGVAGAYSAATTADLLAALRLAQAGAVRGAGLRRDELLARLRPVLAFAEWSGHGEVLGDGVPDTDGDGLCEPAAAGGEHGRLPLLADRVVIDPDAPPLDRPVTWSEHVRPLLLAKCGECHLGGNERGAYRLDTWRALATPGESLGALPMLVPGDPEASFVFEKISRRQPAIGMLMPLQRPPLDDFSKTIVRLWIEQGATRR